MIPSEENTTNILGQLAALREHAAQVRESIIHELGGTALHISQNVVSQADQNITGTKGSLDTILGAIETAAAQQPEPTAEFAEPVSIESQVADFLNSITEAETYHIGAVVRHINNGEQLPRSDFGKVIDALNNSSSAIHMKQGYYRISPLPKSEPTPEPVVEYVYTESQMKTVKLQEIVDAFADGAVGAGYFDADDVRDYIENDEELSELFTDKDFAGLGPRIIASRNNIKARYKSTHNIQVSFRRADGKVDQQTGKHALVMFGPRLPLPPYIPPKPRGIKQRPAVQPVKASRHTRQKPVPPVPAASPNPPAEKTSIVLRDYSLADLQTADPFSLTELQSAHFREQIESLFDAHNSNKVDSRPMRKLIMERYTVSEADAIDILNQARRAKLIGKYKHDGVLNYTLDPSIRPIRGKGDSSHPGRNAPSEPKSDRKAENLKRFIAKGAEIISILADEENNVQRGLQPKQIIAKSRLPQDIGSLTVKDVNRIAGMFRSYLGKGPRTVGSAQVQKVWVRNKAVAEALQADKDGVLAAVYANKSFADYQATISGVDK